MEEPSTEGLLPPEALEAICVIDARLYNHRISIELTNQMAADLGLSLRLIPTFPIGLMGNDISKLLYIHEQAEKRIKKAALAATEHFTDESFGHSEQRKKDKKPAT
jgi:hypothetical protein